MSTWRNAPGLPLVPVFLIAELVLLIAGGSVLGVGPTLLWLVAAFVVGLMLQRRVQAHGLLQTLQRMQQSRGLAGESFEQQRIAFEAMLLLFASLGLMIPGFLTDFGALALLIPPVRRAAARAWVRRVAGPDSDDPAPRATAARKVRRSAGATVDVDVIRPEDAPPSPFDHEVRVINVEPRSPHS